MRIRILGAHQTDSMAGRACALLVDDTLAIDAGSLATGLSLAEQQTVTDVLLSHHHLDHIKDLGTFGLNRFGADGHRTVTIHATPLVANMVSRYVLDPEIWLDFFNWPSRDNPVYAHRVVEVGVPFDIGPYLIEPVAIDYHSVPVTGYQVSRPGHGRLFFSADTGPGCNRNWRNIRPDVLVVETTFGDRLADLAAKVGHLTPASLQVELERFGEHHGYVPRVLVVHVNEAHDEEVRDQIAAIASRLGADVRVGREGEVIDLRPTSVGPRS